MRQHRDLQLVGLALACSPLIAACGGGSSGTSSPGDSARYDGSYRLVQGTVDGAPLRTLAGYPVTLEVDGRKISGRSSCNTYFSTMEVDDGRVSLGAVGGTEMACSRRVMELEERYVAALSGVRSAQATTPSGRLVLEGDGARLVYRAR